MKQIDSASHELESMHCDLMLPNTPKQPQIKMQTWLPEGEECGEFASQILSLLIWKNVHVHTHVHKSK